MNTLQKIGLFFIIVSLYLVYLTYNLEFEFQIFTGIISGYQAIMGVGLALKYKVGQTLLRYYSKPLKFGVPGIYIASFFEKAIKDNGDEVTK